MKYMNNEANMGYSIKSFFNKRPANALLLFFSGFLFAQFILLNILYAKNPFGGWTTALGNIPTYEVLVFCSIALLVCLMIIGFSVNFSRVSEQDVNIPRSLMETHEKYSLLN